MFSLPDREICVAYCLSPDRGLNLGARSSESRKDLRAESLEPGGGTGVEQITTK